MSDATLIVYVRAPGEPDHVVDEVAQVGGVALWPGSTLVTLGANPVVDLAARLVDQEASTLIVGGSVAALLAGLAAGTQLWVGPGTSVRDAVQKVAHAAALARLAGRPPMTPDQARVSVRPDVVPDVVAERGAEQPHQGQRRSGSPTT